MEVLLVVERIFVVYQPSSSKILEHSNKVESEAHEMGQVHAKLYLCIEAQVRKDEFDGIVVVNSMGLESINSNYEVDKDFFDAWRAPKEPWSVYRMPYLDYFIQEGYLFKGL